MIQAGKFHKLKIIRKTPFGFYLDDGEDGILLPVKQAPESAQIGDEIDVFVYFDSDDRLIATTNQPFACVGEIALLECIDISGAGAFLDWGLEKDLFVPHSQQFLPMRKGRKYLVYLYNDERGGRIAATERIEHYISNETLSIKEKEVTDILAYRKTELGWSVIVHGQHLGLIHNDEIFKPISIGDRFEGFVKKILEDNKLDVVPGKPGFQKVNESEQAILQILQDHKGFLPFHDKSDPREIKKVFQMSKKTFKMTIGQLYKLKKIEITDQGIRLI